MRRRTELLESVHQAIDPMQMMQRVCVETLSLISNAENALIGLVDDERTLTYIRGAGTRLDAVGATVQLDGSLSGLANRIGIAVYSEDTENDDRVDREACRRLNAVSLVCVPIRHCAERLGVLTVNAPMPQAFTAADVTLLTQVAEFVGAVVFTSRSLSRSTASMFGLGDEVVDSASAGISAKVRYVANILSPGSVGEALDEELLRKTLDQRAFSMVFQPVYSLSTGALIEVEALARFHTTPYRTPDVWFAMAHSVGLGIELELAAIEMALSFLGRIPEQLSVAINASPEVIGSSALAVMIESVEPTRIVLELTEQIAVANYQHLSGRLADYRKQGVQLAIDDTGSGFASLSHILKLAPDLIKLDRALTTGIDFDPVRRALAKALHSFSSDTGASIIAEGIETAAELVTLQEIGIPYGQGYYLGRPGPVERLKPTFVPLDKSPPVGSKKHTLATSKTPLKGLEISAGVGGLARR